MTLKCLYLQSGAYNAVDDRMLAGFLLDLSADPISGAGRIYSGLLVTAQVTPNMTVNLSPGRAVCPTPASDGGAYAVMNDSNLTVTVAPVSSLPRIDLVLMAVDDADYSGAVYTPKIYILAGTPAGSPVAPTQPAGTVLLATLSHLANATAVANSAIARNQAGTNHDVEYYATAAQSIPASTDRPVAFGVLGYAQASPDITKGTSTNAAIPDARFQLNREGIWTIDAGLRIVGGDTFQIGCWLGNDGGGTRYASALNAQGGNQNAEVGVSCTRRFPAGYALNLNAWQGSGAAKNTDPFNACVHFRATWIRP